MYESRITDTKYGFYALIVLVHDCGDEDVIRGYNGRYLKTRKAAERSTNNYIKKHSLNG